MKKLIVITAALGLCALSTQAQGLLGFANGATSLITFNSGGSNVNATAASGTRVELFYQPGSGSAPAAIYSAGAMNMGAWEATVGGSGNPYALTLSNGRFTGGTDTTGSDVAAGGGAWLTVVGWTGGFANLQAAITGGAQVGESTIFELTTGGGGSPPSSAEPITSSTALTGFLGGTAFGGVAMQPITGTPEPTTLALGGLGAAALLFLRRKK